jgi:hypothetical protein
MDSTSYTKRLRTARALLTLAVLVAALAWFLPRSTIRWGSSKHPSVSASALLHASIVGIFPDANPSFYEFKAACIAMTSLIVLTLAAAPFAVSLLSKAPLLKWLWMLVNLGLVVGLSIGWHIGREFYFISLTVELNPVIYARYSPGFYLAFLAALLHFTGLLRIPSAKSLDRPTLPSSE